MDKFKTLMAVQLWSVRSLSHSMARYLETDEFEGCVLYENLLKLRSEVHAAIHTYMNDVPACDRDSIVRMVKSDLEAL